MISRTSLHRIRVLIWVMCLTVMLFSNFTFFRMYGAKKEGAYEPMSYQEMEKVTQLWDRSENGLGMLQSIDINDYNAIWKARIGGMDTTKDSNAGPKPPDPMDTRPLEQIITILGIVSTGNPEENLVRVMYLEPAEEASMQSSKLDIWKKSGAPLEPPYDGKSYEGKILEIKPGEVIFLFKGERVSLSPTLYGSSAIHP